MSLHREGVAALGCAQLYLSLFCSGPVQRGTASPLASLVCLPVHASDSSLEWRVLLPGLAAAWQPSCSCPTNLNTLQRDFVLQGAPCTLSTGCNEQNGVGQVPSSFLEYYAWVPVNLACMGLPQGVSYLPGLQLRNGCPSVCVWGGVSPSPGHGGHILPAT